MSINEGDLIFFREFTLYSLAKVKVHVTDRKIQPRFHIQPCDTRKIQRLYADHSIFSYKHMIQHTNFTTPLKKTIGYIIQLYFVYIYIYFINRHIQFDFVQLTNPDHTGLVH